jgi:lipopolysaccharide export system protein LptA
MSTTPSSPSGASAERSFRALLFAFPVAFVLAGPAHALSTDREQVLDVKASYQKSTLGGNQAGAAPDVTVLEGNVRMVQGSLKANGDEAKIYDVSKPNSDTTARRLVLTGAPARLEQLMDNDGGKMTAHAATIDYNTDTGIAELTGDVLVIQEGRSEFRGPHMTYNTNTGAMEGGSRSSNSEITMTFQPKAKKAATPATSKPSTDTKP